MVEGGGGWLSREPAGRRAEVLWVGRSGQWVSGGMAVEKGMSRRTGGRETGGE